MNNRYIVATKEGKKPSHILTQKQIQQALDLCQRGWPDEEWAVFHVDVQNRATKWDDTIINLHGHSDLIKTLREELEDRLGEGYKVNLHES